MFVCQWQIPWSKMLTLSDRICSKMVRHLKCMILSNQHGHTEDGWRDSLCTPVLLGLLQGRLPRRLRSGRRARLQKLHCSPLVKTPSSNWHCRTRTNIFLDYHAAVFLRKRACVLRHPTPTGHKHLKREIACKWYWQVSVHKLLCLPYT